MQTLACLTAYESLILVADVFIKTMKYEKTIINILLHTLVESSYTH